MAHSPEQARKKQRDIEESEKHHKYGRADGFMTSGSDFDRPGERYYTENPVSKERLEKEYIRNPNGSYTHKPKGTY